MLNADNRFSGFAMRIKEDRCSYTNHQNDVTYYNMVTQHKNSKIPIIQQSSSISIIHYTDFLNSDKMLIKVVDMNNNLTRAPEAFYLLAPSDDTKFAN